MKSKKKIARLFLVPIMACLLASNGVVPEEGSHEKAVPERQTLKTLFPGAMEAPGWDRSPDILFYESANLWDYINGQAELYLQYGFRLVGTTGYTFKKRQNALTVEIYQMKTPRHAFGIYAAERSPDDEFVEIGVQGYIGENVLNFWKGPYYVKLTSYKKLPAMKESLKKFAGTMAGKIPGTFSEPPLFNCFPEAHKVKRSERFIPENFLGHPFLKNGYRLDYLQDGMRYQVFLAENSSPAEAKKAFRKYMDFLKSGDKKYSRIKETGYQAIRIKADTRDVLFQYGSYIGGVLHIEEFSGAEKIIKDVVERLKRQNKKGGKP